MSRSNMRLSGTQIRRLWGEVEKYSEKYNLSVGDVVVTIVGQSGRVVLTDYDWDNREMSSEHTNDTPQPETVRGFSASVWAV